MPIRAQPLLVVADVQRASRWYQQVLGAASGHGGGEYDQILVDGSMVLQLHARDLAHHHGAIADSDRPVGNGVAIWFEPTTLTPSHDVALPPAQCRDRGARQSECRPPRVVVA
jgi:hypothetical protein